MTAKGNYTIGVVNGKENYTTVQKRFKDILEDINQLVDEKEINVDGKQSS